MNFGHAAALGCLLADPSDTRESAELVVSHTFRLRLENGCGHAWSNRPDFVRNNRSRSRLRADEPLGNDFGRVTSEATS
jgi:hypothetical protein